MTWINNVLKRWAVLMLPAMLVSVALGCIFGASLRQGVSVVVFFATVLTGNLLFNRVDARLAWRAKANAPFAWAVWINDVKVGTVTDAEYAAIQCLALHDGNLVRVVAVVLVFMLVAGPLGVLWSDIALAVMAPISHTDVVRNLQHADPAAVTGLVRTLVQYGGPFLMLFVVGVASMGYRFGFRNHYSAAIAKMLRQHFNTPADGDIRLVRMSLQHGLPTPHFGYAHD